MKYIVQLDGLRCFAIISVIIGHWVSWDTDNWFIKNFPWNHGVILFFVLSGFLITSILLELKENVESRQITYFRGIRNFYVRRTLRIFPIYYLTIFFAYYINYKNSHELFPWLVTYTTNIYEGRINDMIGPFNHFWSLAVEEQFYLLWPFLLLAIPKKRIPHMLIALMALGLLSRLGFFIVAPDRWTYSAYLTPHLFPPLALGGLMAYRKKYFEAHFRNTITHFSIFYIAAALYFFLFFINGEGFFRAVLDEYVYSIFAAALVARSSVNGFRFVAKAILENKVVVYLGIISYGLYVYPCSFLTFSGILSYRNSISIRTSNTLCGDFTRL